jgi:hypothetical protein
MNTFVENKIINLNSNNATKKNGTFLSSVYFDFIGMLKDDNDIRNVFISVQNAEFPYSFYNINIYNNTFTASFDSDPPITITLTRGNYNANTLITEMINQLEAANLKHFSINISRTTGLLTFTNNNHNFTFYAATSTCFKVLGFDPTLNYTSVARTLTAPYPLNLLGTLKLRVTSYLLFIDALDSNVGGNLNVLASLPINAGNFGLIMFENKNNIQYKLNTRVLNGFDIEILDDDGNLVNFNNTYWTITLLLTIEREIYVAPVTAGFSDIVKANVPQETKETEISENEVQLTLDEGGELLTEAPNLEETIPLPDDLELLLYSKGIR